VRDGESSGLGFRPLRDRHVVVGLARAGGLEDRDRTAVGLCVEKQVAAVEVLLDELLVLGGVPAADDQELVARVKPPESLVPPLALSDRNRGALEPVFGLVRLRCGRVVFVVVRPGFAFGADRGQLLTGLFDRGLRAGLFLLDLFCLPVEPVGVFLDAVSHSSVWKDQKYAGDAYAVGHDQVSKTPESGEYLEKGGFAVRGDRTYFEDVPVDAAVGITCEPETRIIGGPRSPIEARAETVVAVEPGRYAQGDVAKRIYRTFRSRFTDESLVRKVASPDLIQEFLPPGTSTIEE